MHKLKPRKMSVVQWYGEKSRVKIGTAVTEGAVLNQVRQGIPAV